MLPLLARTVMDCTYLEIASASSYRSSAPRTPKPPRAPTNLEWLFAELDADSSGHISRSELEAAILQIYGSPLEPKILDEMMREADTDGDGEISLTEFKRMMHAANKHKGRSRDGRSARTMWGKVKDRAPTRLIKASNDMQRRRETFTKQRMAKVNQALDEMFLAHPEYWKSKKSMLPDLPPAPSSGPAPLPNGGGLPPKAQAQMGARKKKLNRTNGFGKRKKNVDLEAGEGGKAGEELEEQDFVTWITQTVQSISMSCIVASLVEAVDLAVSIGPLLVALLLPATWVITEVRDLVNSYYAEPGVVFPPPPPSAPDMAGRMHELELSFYDFAQQHPVDYLVVDLGLGFAIAALALFWKDINDFIERRKLEAATAAKSKVGYEKLEDNPEQKTPQPRSRRRGGLNSSAMKEQLKQATAKQALSPQEMRMELNKTITAIEKVRAFSAAAWGVERWENEDCL